MEKPILLWDRSQCSEQVCTCHDDSSPPRFCTGCGCNVASPGHRNTLDAFDRQAARIAELENVIAVRAHVEQGVKWENEARGRRIAELEGALRDLQEVSGQHVSDLTSMARNSSKLIEVWKASRRVLGEGGRS